jgi:cysteinyl-tRNA synthetase
VLFDLANELNRTREPRLAGLLKSLGGILGLLQRDPNDFLQGRDVAVNLFGVSARGETGTVSVITMSEDEIKQKIDLRTDARRAKNFEEADRIRDELLHSGVVLEDTAQGTTWRRS